MKPFSVALLVGAASQSFAYNIHSSCDCGDHRDAIKSAMEEAKAVLSWTSLTGTACAMWERRHETGDEPQSMYDTCKDQGRRSILDDFLGDHGATAYEAITSRFFIGVLHHDVQANRWHQMLSDQHPRFQGIILNQWMGSPLSVETVT